MNNFSKVYSVEELKKNKIVTLVTLPMEESILMPVAQIIDLMKNGENVIFFTFNHDSIKVNEFLVPALKNEPNPEKITGGLSIIDAHQVPSGVGFPEFIESEVSKFKTLLEKEGKTINFVFIDLPKELLEETGTYDILLNKVKFQKNVTSILVKTLEMPVFVESQLRDEKKLQKELDEFIDKDLIDSLLIESVRIVNSSDMIIGVQRKRETFWKKVFDFLFFWRKRSNFTLKVLKNSSGANSKSYRMNINLDEFKSEVL
jgi:hypothetical protein